MVVSLVSFDCTNTLSFWVDWSQVSWFHCKHLPFWEKRWESEYLCCRCVMWLTQEVRAHTIVNLSETRNTFETILFMLLNRLLVDTMLEVWAAIMCLILELLTRGVCWKYYLYAGIIASCLLSQKWYGLRPRLHFLHPAQYRGGYYVCIFIKLTACVKPWRPSDSDCWLFVYSKILWTTV